MADKWDEEPKGFPCEECLWRLSDLQGAAAEVLAESSGLLESLQARQSGLGVGIARCLRVGALGPWTAALQPEEAAAGLTAGDEECYETFQDLFDPVISRLHPGPGEHRSDTALNQLSTLHPDPEGRYVLSSQVSVSRSLRGYRFPPAMEREEREEVERLLAGALLELPGFPGAYMPLRGSESYAPRPGGMEPDEEVALKAHGQLFGPVPGAFLVASGAGRDWPEGRGIFSTFDRSLTAWVNEQEHLQLITSRSGEALQSAFSDLTCALRDVAGLVAKAESSRVAVADSSEVFSFSKRLGFLNSNPLRVGSAMEVSVVVALPLLSRQETSLASTLGGTQLRPPAAAWRSWCTAQRISVRPVCIQGSLQVPGLFQISNIDRLGLSEVQTVNLVIEVVARLVEAEKRLEAGQPMDQLFLKDVAATSPSPELLEAQQRSLAEARVKEDLKDRAMRTFRFGLETGLLQSALEQMVPTDPGIVVARRTPPDGQSRPVSVFSDRLVEITTSDVAEDLVLNLIQNEIVYRAAAATAAFASEQDVSVRDTLDEAPEPAEVLDMEVVQELVSVLLEAEQGEIKGTVITKELITKLVQEPVNNKSSVDDKPKDAEGLQLVEPDELRIRLQKTLVDAIGNGDLEKALHTTLGASRSPTGQPKAQLDQVAADEGPETDIDSLRMKLQEAMMDGLESGVLQKALQQVLSAKSSGSAKPPELPQKVLHDVPEPVTILEEDKARAALEIQRIARGRQARANRAQTKGKYTLKYFDMPGLAEPIRLLFLLGGINFVDERVSFESWGPLKPKTKWGHLPILITPNGKEMSQSLPIAKFVAKMVEVNGRPLYPTDPVEAFAVEEVINAVEDVRAHIRSTVGIAEQAEKAEAQSKLFAEGGAITELLRKIDRFVGPHFAVNETLSLADVWIFCFLNFFRSGFRQFPGVPTTFLSSHTKLASIVGKVGSLSRVKDYYNDMKTRNPVYNSFAEDVVVAPVASAEDRKAEAALRIQSIARGRAARAQAKAQPAPKEKEVITASDAKVQEAHVVLDAQAQPEPKAVPNPPATTSYLALRSQESVSIEIVPRILEVISGRSRRVGELGILLQEAKRSVEAREQLCRNLEDELLKQKLEISHLDLDIDWHKQALISAEARRVEILTAHRSLFDEMEAQRQKARLNVTEPLPPISGLSDTQTSATSLSSPTAKISMSGTGGSLLTPRVAPQGLSLAPLTRPGL